MFNRHPHRSVPRGALWVSERGQASYDLPGVLHVLLVLVFMLYPPPPVGACPREPSGHLLEGRLFMFYLMFLMFYLS